MARPYISRPRPLQASAPWRDCPYLLEPSLLAPLPPIAISQSKLELGKELPPLPPSATEDEVYHVLSKRKKWQLVYLVSVAGMFSPLSSNIYFPALDSISSALRASSSLVALTITVYMVVQGLAPSFWGPLSDARGRRLVLLATLSIYLIANLFLAFTPNFPTLLALRGLQAAGSASTISIGTGVIADIALPSERGGFIGTNSGIRMMGQALGPVIGGVLNGFFGFRSIFWFLFILGASVFVLLLLFLPETHRVLAGNGSVPLRGIHRPWIDLVKSKPFKHPYERSCQRKTPRLTFKSVLAPLRHLFEKDIAALLVWGALVYTTWSMVTSSTTTVIKAEFLDVSEIQLGLCFLPNGLGCVLGSIITGKMMDRNFKRVEKQYRQAHNIPPDVKVKGDKSFPYERARLKPMPALSAILIVSIVLYGLSYELNDLAKFAFSNLLVSLILQFFIAYTATAIFSINSAIVVDCFPGGAAGAAAINNLVRCTVGAAGVALIEPMIELLRIRNSFIVLATILLVASPLVWVEAKWGETWRHQREARSLTQETDMKNKHMAAKT